MKALVVYFSKFGNTKLVAETISARLNRGAEVRLISSDELAAVDFEGVDLVVMGSPTHKMNLPEAVRSIFEMLPKKTLKGKRVAAFDTSYEMSALLSRFTAGKRLAKKLRKLGGRRVLPPEIFRVTGREGPLYDGELERAGAWAERLLDRAAA